MSNDGHEFDLIAQFRRQAETNTAVTLGIGDDAALLASPGDKGVLVTNDVLMERVHFDLSIASPADVGRKALAVNLSDIAAMAGRPTAAFVGLVLPAEQGAGFADELMSGLMKLADEYDVAIAGGDTNIWDGPAVISVTLLGEPTNPGPVLRKGAQPGDWLLVTGALGGSLGGRHLHFSPRLHEAQYLNASVELHALIDLSDGLASDIQHILVESRVGAVLDQDSIPIHDDVDQELDDHQRLMHALSDGEDFELLMAVDPTTGAELLAQPPFGTSLTRIGEITDGEGCWLQPDDGDRTRLAPIGWQHRFSTPK